MSDMYMATMNEYVYGKLYKSHKVEADSKTNLMKRLYSFERSSRYDSARVYEVVEKNIAEDYSEWKRHGMTMQDFYGSAVVD